ncbi:MAG: hypothetical protein F6K62_25285 [Sphaerospermopsis sp. SIO1G2]|nr:hypothetical protein [Sphaerospermopsis sp. SIO1G2]
MSILSKRKFQLSAGIISCFLAILAHQNISAQAENKYTNTQLEISQSESKTKNNSVFYSVVDEWQKYKYSVNGKRVLKQVNLPNAKVSVNDKDLLTVLNNTRTYFQKYQQKDPNLTRNGLLLSQGVTIEKVLETLDFMIDVLEEDISNNRPSRLQDTNFINANFRVIKWSAHNPKKPKQKQLRITKYAVFSHTGSRTKTAKYNIPLYSLKDDIDNTNKFYTKYTKQDVLSGIYEPGGKEFGKVEPLAYLTRSGLESALMQGTILINFTDGTKAFFNVDRNNGISYVKGLNPRLQKRYWYFRKVDDIKGYGHKIDSKIAIKPGVTFAGDVLNIGLGRIIVMEYNRGGKKHLKMGVIADTGGAFLPNLHQLDYLAGIFKDYKEFQQYIRQLPQYATPYILVKK